MTWYWRAVLHGLEMVTQVSSLMDGGDVILACGHLRHFAKPRSILDTQNRKQRHSFHRK